MKPKPVEAIVAVNYRCNAKCQMCDIWRIKQDGTLVPEDYTRLPSGLSNVGITGGEPFLRKDLVDIVRVVFEAAGHPRIVISTNGYLTDRIVRAFREFRRHRLKVGVGVSMDGIGATHDLVRGTRGAYEKVCRTIEALKAESVRDIRLSYTATNENIADLVKVYELARKLRVQFASTIAHNSPHYFQVSSNSQVDKDLLRQAYQLVNQRELSSSSLKGWFRAYYNHGIVRFNEEGVRLVSCTAAKDFFFVSPTGDIYPCIIIPRVIGNLMERPFAELWGDAQTDMIRAEVDGCERCWMMCSARSALKRSPVPAARWVIKEKVKLALRGSNASGAASCRPKL